MKLRKLIYGLLLLISVYSCFMYYDEFPSLLLNFLLLLGIICKVQTMVSAKKLFCSLENAFYLSKKDQVRPVSLRIFKSGILPAGFVETIVTMEDISRKKQEKQRLEIWIQNRKEMEKKFLLRCSDFGYYEVKISQVRVIDLLGLSSSAVRFQKENSTHVFVLPEALSMFIQIKRKIDLSVGEKDIFSMDQSGNDSSQVYDIRSYIEGDRMQTIHWKLSQKTDSLLVKEFSMPLGWPGKILLEFDKIENFLNVKSLQTLISLYQTLQLLKIRFQIVWQREDGIFFSSSSESSIEELFYRLFQEKIGTGRATLWEYECQYPEQKCEHLFYITDHLNESNGVCLEQSHNANHKTVFCCEMAKTSVSCRVLELTGENWRDVLQSTPIEF